MHRIGSSSWRKFFAYYNSKNNWIVSREKFFTYSQNLKGPSLRRGINESLKCWNSTFSILRCCLLCIGVRNWLDRIKLYWMLKPRFVLVQRKANRLMKNKPSRCLIQFLDQEFNYVLLIGVLVDSRFISKLNFGGRLWVLAST